MKIPRFDKDLYKEIEIEEKTTRVNDVIWAVMKLGESKDNGPLAKKYPGLAYKRIKLYEDFVKNLEDKP